MSIYEELKRAGVALDNHESDLHAEVTGESRKIVDRYRFAHSVSIFTSNIDGKLWYDIPFAYTPWWKERQKVGQMMAKMKEGGK